MTSPMPTPSIKRAIIYLRVSSRGQVETDYDPEGISLPAQRAAAHRRAAELSADVVAEFVEPGRSATGVDNRPEFQRMMAMIKARKDIDYVIVYSRSRMHRNAIDAAITKRDLRTAGTRLISVTDYTEDSAVGDLVGTVLDAVNEYQSRASGADISYKMSQKAARGGCTGRSPLGYLNVREQFEGREVRTVAIDPERGPLVRMAFELYATGTYSFQDLAEMLTDAGLRMKPDKNHPTGARISIHKIGKMLRDRYYLGYLIYKGVEYQGRHEPLINPELFDKVQEVLYVQRGAGTRARTHNHYLKGTVWCDRCKRRLIVMRGKSKSGNLYFYYVCRGRQERACDLPYLPIDDVETAVAEHYTAIALPAKLRDLIRAGMDAALASSITTLGTLHDEVKKQLAEIDRKEDHFLDLVGDPDWPKEKLAKRMRTLRDERARLEYQLDQIERPDLDGGHQALTMLLGLLSEPHKLYEIADEHARRLLNQAFFTRLYLDASDDDRTPAVAADEATEPVAPLLHVHRAANNNGGASTGTAVGGTSALLVAALDERCSSNATWVELWGFEPQTSSMPWKRATNCAIAPCCVWRALVERGTEKILADSGPASRHQFPRREGRAAGRCDGKCLEYPSRDVSRGGVRDTSVLL